MSKQHALTTRELQCALELASVRSAGSVPPVSLSVPSSHQVEPPLSHQPTLDRQESIASNSTTASIHEELASLGRHVTQNDDALEDLRNDLLGEIRDNFARFEEVLRVNMNNGEQDANADPNSDAIENGRRMEEAGEARSSVTDKVVRMYKQMAAKYDFEDGKGIVREPNATIRASIIETITPTGRIPNILKWDSLVKSMTRDHFNNLKKDYNKTEAQRAAEAPVNRAATRKHDVR
ncbi:hypothetical protein BDA99DRAFT_610567 [Phascolomyces articulosus]|uniref:Uncharacterized protein n=1 Tax=Phascolomyces articulosus TaxID=60185 RepID=A0AAD5P6R9_9FUNG|nr:hypothetical protein BDA99DRAFT_610567 [Phascolomyces articulosus]